MEAFESNLSVSPAARDAEDWEGRSTLQRSSLSTVWCHLRRSPGAMIGLSLIVLLIVTAVFAAVIAPQGIDDQNLRKGPPGNRGVSSCLEATNLVATFSVASCTAPAFRSRSALSPPSFQHSWGSRSAWSPATSAESWITSSRG